MKDTLSLLVVLVLVLVLSLVLLLLVVVVVVAAAVVAGGGGGTNKDWGPQNKLPELILEFAWCSLRASMGFSTVLKKNFGIDFWLVFLIRLKLPGLLFDRSAAEILQKGAQQGRFGSL